MSLTVGQFVWVTCEVKPGPFSDQRIVRVNSPVVHSQAGSWIGFVTTKHLREPIEVGSTGAAALIVGVVGDRFQAQVMGEPLSNTVFEDLVSRAQPIDSLKA
jgi:hypothetical protein